MTPPGVSVMTGLPVHIPRFPPGEYPSGLPDPAGSGYKGQKKHGCTAATRLTGLRACYPAGLRSPSSSQSPPLRCTPASLLTS